MSKINNKTINKGLRILTILAFSLIFVPFNQAAAQSTCGETGCNIVYQTVPGSYSGNAYTNYNNNSYYSAPYQAPVYIAPAPAVTPVVYSKTENPNPVMTVNYTPTKTVAKAKTTPKTDSASALTANAINGSDSFLPSGLVQWILFAIGILLAVILVRRVFGGTTTYHESPMKHE